MTIETNDIFFVYSGSGTNANPSASLGGPPAEIITTNSIFDGLSAAEGEEGMTDYRCLYLVNDSPTAVLNNFSFVITKDDPTLGTSDVQVLPGFILRNEVQTLTIVNYENVTSGTIELTYTHAEFPPKTFNITIASPIDAGVISTIEETIYSNLMSLENYAVETVVTHTIPGPDLKINIEFSGFSQNKSHTILAFNDDGLVSVPAESAYVNIDKTVEGSPINTNPDEIANELVPPSGVVFYTTNPVLGNLEPGDVVPVWLKRKVPAGSRAVSKDGFTLKARGQAFSEDLT